MPAATTSPSSRPRTRRSSWSTVRAPAARRRRASTSAIGADGSIELREAVAATTVDGEAGLRDEALSGDGRYLYALHADAREVFAWAVGEDGSLRPLGSANGLPATAAGLAAS